MAPVTTFGPGGRFTQKNGRAIQIDTTNPVRTEINKGVTTKNNKGSMKLNMTGYQLMPVKKGGAPFALKANTVEGMIAEVNNLPLEYFDPNGKVGLQPDLKIGLNGYTVNEANVLGDVNDKMFDIAEQLSEAIAKGDKEKQGVLESMQYNLEDIKNMIGTGDYDERELLLAANKSGIRKVKEDWILPADGSDIAAIKNVTGGFNLADKSFWSEDMTQLQAAYQNRYKEAEAKGFGAEKKEEPKSEGTPKVTNAEEYAKLSSGTEYIGPDGQKRRKK
jgi:hypothetical protein